MNIVTVIISLGLLFYFLSCWLIIDIAKKDFGALQKKALWGFITLIPFIGPVIYLLFGYKKGRSS